MTVTQNISTFQVAVDYYTTHKSHQKELAHLLMSNDLKLKLAAKLHQAVSLERILDNIRDTFSRSGVTRNHLVSRKDLHNIRVQDNIEGILQHKNDLTSVSAWVEEMQPFNYVLRALKILSVFNFHTAWRLRKLSKQQKFPKLWYTLNTQHTVPIS